MANVLRAKRSWTAFCLVLVGLAGCGGAQGAKDTSSEAGHILSEKQAKVALHTLPYVYAFRSVQLPARATSAFAGEAKGPDHTHVQFGISLGKHAAPVPVPKAGVVEVTGVPAAGFTFTDDLVVEVGEHEYHAGPNLHNDKQERIADEMTTDMEEALCLAATGQICGI